MSSNKISTWTPERSARLLELRAAGRSYRECIAILGEFDNYTDGGLNSVKKRLARLNPELLRKSPWTEERRALLTEIYQQGSLGWLADEINRRTGSSFTICAVAGQSDRLGLMKKYPRAQDGSATQQRLKYSGHKGSAGSLGSKLLTAQFPKPLASDVKSLKQYEAKGPPKHFNGIPFRNLEPNHCRYPYDIDGVTMFCGQEKMETSSYCVRCHPLCWRPAPKRPAMSKAEREIIIRKMIKQGSQAAA